MKNNDTAKWSVTGLRTRYFPKNRIGHGFLIISPWLDFLLLVLFLILLDKHIVLQPGVVVDLDKGAFADGTHNGIEVVVMSVKGINGHDSEDIIYYDDVRFRMADKKSRAQLQQSFRKKKNAIGNDSLIIYADKNVAHGTIMELMDIADKAGIARVNMAVREL